MNVFLFNDSIVLSQDETECRVFKTALDARTCLEAQTLSRLKKFTQTSFVTRILGVF